MMGVWYEYVDDFVGFGVVVYEVEVVDELLVVLVVFGEFDLEKVVLVGD